MPSISIHNTNTKVHLVDLRYCNRSNKAHNKGHKLDKSQPIEEYAYKRKRKNVSRLVECNANYDGGISFVTLTLDKLKVNDRKDLSELKKNWILFVKRFRYEFGTNFEYIAIPENHSDGAWHIHFICFGFSYIDFNKLYKCWSHGAVYVEPGINVPTNCAGYIAKYIGKFKAESGEIIPYHKGDRFVWRSRKLNKGSKELLTDVPTAAELNLIKIFGVGVQQQKFIPSFDQVLQSFLDDGYIIEYVEDHTEYENRSCNTYIRLSKEENNKCLTQ